MQVEIETLEGPTIQLRALDQSHTYEGLLEGLPHATMNKAITEQAVAMATGKWAGRAHLIVPEETPINYPGNYPFGVPASIPAVCCISRWISSDVEGFGEDADYTELAVVWFQQEMALPIAPDIVRQLQRLDWRMHALAREY